MSELDELVDELLAARTMYDTVHLLRLRNLPDQEIVKQLRKRYGVSESHAYAIVLEHREGRH